MDVNVDKEFVKEYLKHLADFAKSKDPHGTRLSCSAIEYHAQACTREEREEIGKALDRIMRDFAKEQQRSPGKTGDEATEYILGRLRETKKSLGLEEKEKGSQVDLSGSKKDRNKGRNFDEP